MNEELQSTNEELETTNEELHQRTEELNDSNDFLESVLKSVQVGVIVVDQDLRIKAWNLKSEDLWGLCEEEVQGHHFLNLDIGLKVERLKQAMRDCLAGEDKAKDVMLPAINRRGKSIECRVTCTPLRGQPDGIRGVILMVEDKDAQG